MEPAQAGQLPCTALSTRMIFCQKLVGLVESIEYHVTLLLREQQAIGDNRLASPKVAKSFAPPPTKQDERKDKSYMFDNIDLFRL